MPLLFRAEVSLTAGHAWIRRLIHPSAVRFSSVLALVDGTPETNSISWIWHRLFPVELHYLVLFAKT